QAGERLPRPPRGKPGFAGGGPHPPPPDRRGGRRRGPLRRRRVRSDPPRPGLERGDRHRGGSPGRNPRHDLLRPAGRNPAGGAPPARPHLLGRGGDDPRPRTRRAVLRGRQEHPPPPRRHRHVRGQRDRPQSHRGGRPADPAPAVADAGRLGDGIGAPGQNSRRLTGRPAGPRIAELPTFPTPVRSFRRHAMRTQTFCLLALMITTPAWAQKDSVRTGAALAPTIQASENTVISYTGTVPAMFTGALDADDSTYNRATTCGALSGVGTAAPFDTIVITNNSPGTANVVIFSSLVGGGVCGNANDTFFTLYNGAFNPAAALTNCVAVNDDIAAAAN